MTSLKHRFLRTPNANALMTLFAHGFMVLLSISPTLLQSIVHPEDCALDAWNQIENNFQNDKTSHILHLESQFKELSLFSNVKAYCNEL